MSGAILTPLLLVAGGLALVGGLVALAIRFGRVSERADAAELDRKLMEEADEVDSIGGVAGGRLGEYHRKLREAEGDDS